MELNFKTFGQGPPLILLHGLFGTLDNWQTLAKRWADDYTVVLVDQRNHGKSPHVDKHDYQHMAEDLKVFMEANWMYEAHLLGHSMGGKTVMQFAQSFPDMIDKLIVVDIAPKAYPGGHETILTALNGLDLSLVTDRKDAANKLSINIQDSGVLQFLLKNLRRSKSGGFEWKMNLSVLTRQYPEILNNIELTEVYEGPTLFIRGADSDYINDDDIPSIKEHFLDAKIATVEGAGHWVHAQQPTELFQLVSTFLNS